MHLHPHRTIRRLGLCLLLLAPIGAFAKAGVTPQALEWLSAMVAKVETADNTQGKGQPLVVEMRIVIDAGA